MFSKVTSSAVLGVDGTLISVEADINDGLPMFTMVGYLSSSVKEAGERVRTALKNSGYRMPPKRITINLSPADIRKDGSGFDLPIAVAVLLSMGIVPSINMDSTLIIGELSLDGTVKPIHGVLSMVHHAYLMGYKSCIVPVNNAYEAALVKGMNVFCVKNLNEAIDFVKGEIYIKPIEFNEAIESVNISSVNDVDFADIKGQEMLKRGLEIAAAGFHNVLMTGAAGSGKSMLAKRVPTIMPHMSFEESIDVTKIYSISGLLDDNSGLVRKRPFRSPHHTISNYALIGGGNIPKPGEISLAHNGVLFLDELAEFNKNVLEVMRQPIEERKITISRVNAKYVFPAHFMLVAAMNPCPCGHYPDMNKCTCSPVQIKKYQSKISGPLLDRIDINLGVKPVKSEDIFSRKTEETSAEIRERVERARNIQEIRYKGENISFNSQLDGDLLNKYIILKDNELRLLNKIFNEMELSARGVYRIMKLARTIADLDGSENILEIHLQEAAFFRNTKDKISGGWC